jgi:hypothetical protein
MSPENRGRLKRQNGDDFLDLGHSYLLSCFSIAPEGGSIVQVIGAVEVDPQPQEERAQWSRWMYAAAWERRRWPKSPRCPLTTSPRSHGDRTVEI